MAVEYINFVQHGIVFQEEDVLLKNLFEKIEKSKKKYLIVRSTWLDQEVLEDQIKNKNFDAVVVCSLMDTPHLNFNFLNNYPVYNIGYYKNSPFYFDFHAYMVSKYLKIDQSVSLDYSRISVPFMSLNGKPSIHRIEFVTKLIKENLIEKNIVSLNSISKDKLFFRVDKFKPTTITPSPFDVYTLGGLDNWHRHFLNVVTETVYDTESLFFITEKTYKPILGYKPFLVYSNNGSVNMLKRFGFEVYNDDFKDITDLDLNNADNYVEFLKILSSQHIKYFQKKYKFFKEKILYNRNHFFKHLDTQIKNLKEFSNFDF